MSRQVVWPGEVSSDFPEDEYSKHVVGPTLLSVGLSACLSVVDGLRASELEPLSEDVSRQVVWPGEVSSESPEDEYSKHVVGPALLSVCLLVVDGLRASELEPLSEDVLRKVVWPDEVSSDSPEDEYSKHVVGPALLSVGLSVCFSIVDGLRALELEPLSEDVSRQVVWPVEVSADSPEAEYSKLVVDFSLYAGKFSIFLVPCSVSFSFSEDPLKIHSSFREEFLQSE